MADGPFRIRDKATGHEYTVAAIYDPQAVEVLDEPAVDDSGRYLPPKTAAPKKSAQTKEAAK